MQHVDTVTEPANGVHSVGAVARGHEFLAFRLGAEEYGVEILKVQEIRRFEKVTAIANLPPCVKGVINLRGTIVPVVDLRIKVGFEHVAYDDLTVVIILNLARRVVGIVVDSVADVITLAPEQIRPAPEFSSSLCVDHITGLGTISERMLILIDIEAFIAGEGMTLSNSGLHS